MLVKIFIISIILISVSVAGLAFNIIFRKKGRFPSFRVGHNKDMKKLGITCVNKDEPCCYNKQEISNCNCELVCRSEN